MLLEVLAKNVVLNESSVAARRRSANYTNFVRSDLIPIFKNFCSWEAKFFVTFG